MRPLTTLLIALLLWPVLAAAQAPPKGMTMHRQAAGRLDSAGWTDAVSTRGGFSVRMPTLFNDFTVNAPPGKGAVATTHVVGARRADGVKFLAARMIYRAPGQAGAYFARIAAGHVTPGKTVTVRRHTHAGRRAVDATLETARARARMRYVLAGETMMLLNVETPKAGRAAVPEATIRAFLDSLRVTR